MRQTDSMSNLSDMSGNTAVQASKPRMDVACVIDTVHTEHIAHRKCALDELKQACSLVNANLHQIQVNFSPNHIILFVMPMYCPMTVKTYSFVCNNHK